MADQDVYRTTISFLQAEGHDVVRAVDVGLAQASDAELLRFAHRERRLLVTRDRDFGTLVFAHDAGGGVVLLRILPSSENAVHLELARVLTTYSEQTLLHGFVAVEPARHRFRRLTS
jgi:predicted nuclease of predicted toxin-antitoxin system